METNKRSQKKSKFKIELPHHFKENETFIIDQIGISNKFNEYFINWLDQNWLTKSKSTM